MSWLSEDADRFDDYDESAAKVRPPKRGSKPRTKNRPAHDDSIEARVITVDRGRYLTLADEGTRKNAKSSRNERANCREPRLSPVIWSTSSATPRAGTEHLRES